MVAAVDLQQLSQRESEQTEWKENVANIDDVVETLSAFANDLSNLGGGYVVCGAKEEKDEHGFPRLAKAGLTAARLREVQGTVLTRCRDRVSPPITPMVEELPANADDRRILVFIQPATSQAHTFRRGDEGSKHFVRVGSSTIEARNGVLRDLLVRKGALEPWDRRPCSAATTHDLDLLALRDALQRMGGINADRSVESYLSESVQLSPFVPPLCTREPLTGVLRPRNFAMLLFGRDVQRFVPGAFSLFSIYPGTDRSAPHAERHEIAGTLIEQARRLNELLDVQSYIAFDKTDLASPNAMKYPKRALYEAMGNALAHRDYELPDPTRLTVFSDRIEVYSPGSLPLGVDPSAFREGRAEPKWRNQGLAWFFNRLQLAQAEGQGIPTILRVMREEGCPPPTLEADTIRVLCVLPAHPRHALLQELRAAEHAIALGELQRAQDQVRAVLARDALNFRALRLFGLVQQALHEPEPVADWAAKHAGDVDGLPPAVLVQLAEALMSSAPRPEPEFQEWVALLLNAASKLTKDDREVRRTAVAWSRAGRAEAVLELIDQKLQEHPEWRRNASLLQLKGDALLGLAKRCKSTARNSGHPSSIRRRAWSEFHAYLERAERQLRTALEASVDEAVTKLIRQNLDSLQVLRRDNQPRRRGGRR
jgi:ATP-dependent DNA helicase RecG